MPIIVRATPESSPIEVTAARLREDIIAGRTHHLIAASIDGGTTWIEGWRAVELPPPRAPGGLAPAEDGALIRMVLPVGRSWWAIVTGYLALLTLVADLFLILAMVLVSGARSARAPRSPFPLSMSAILIAAFGLPQIATALLAFRAIRADPRLHGMGRVWFSLTCVGVLVVGIGAATMLS